jgi:hypothetical protein
VAKSEPIKVGLDTSDFEAGFAGILRTMQATSVAFEVVGEVTKAAEKHGDQKDMALGFGSDESLMLDLYNETGLKMRLLSNADLANVARSLEQSTSKAGKPSWARVIFEEFAEAIAEDEWAKQRAELLQNGAMIVAAILAGDHQNSAS